MPGGSFLANVKCWSTLLFFFSGNQATYGGEAIVWDMLCRGIDVEDEDEVEEAGIFLEEVDLLLAELVAEEMSDRKNGNGSCGNGSITLTGQYGRPWEGPYEYWPTEGWAQAGANLWVHVETEHEAHGRDDRGTVGLRLPRQLIRASATFRRDHSSQQAV